MSDSFVDEHERRTSSSSLKGIPIPDEIKDEFSSFFDSSSNPDDFKFIFDLNQYNSVSIWKDSTRGMDKTEQRIPFETPTGMKTIDHYFSKRSSLNKTYDSSIKEKEKSSKQSKTVSQSPVKSNNDKDETEPILSPSKEQLNNTDNILSQDIFDKNDSVSSNEYSKQNEEILGECDVVPCTQFNESIVSRFNSSNLINSGSVANGSSDSESECDKSNVSSVRKSFLTSEDDVKHSKNSSERSLVIQKGKDRMKVSDKVKNDHRNTKSPLKANMLVKTRKTDSSSSSSDDEHKSSSKAMNTSVDLNKSNVRKTNRRSSSKDEDSNPSSKFNTSATLNELKYKKISGSSSSSDGETKVTASVGMNKLNQRKSRGSNSSSSDEENKSSSKANTSMKMNKSLDKKSSVSSSSSDEESKSSSKTNTSMNLNKSKDKKSSVSSSSSDEDTKSSSKANTSMNLNKSLDKKSSVSSSSSDEENKSSSKANTSMNLNKSKNEKSSVSSSSSDEESKSSSKANTSMKMNKSLDKKSSVSSSSSDEENKSSSKANTSSKMNKSKDKKSSGGSWSSDGNRKSVPQSSASKMSNSSRLKDSDSSSDDEETRSDQKASLAKNKIQLSNKESSSSSSDSENEVDKWNVSVDKRKPTSSLNSRNNSNSEDERKHLRNVKLGGKVKNNEELQKNMFVKAKSNFNVNRDSSDSSDAESDTEKNCVDIKSTGSLRSAIALKKSGKSGSDESDNHSGPSNSNLKKLENKWATEKSGKVEKRPRNDSDCSSNSVNSKKNIDKISSNLKPDAKRSRSDSSSDDNEFSFKNKEIGKILGLNAIGSTRNMSLSGHKIAKSLEIDPEIKISPKKDDQSGTEDSESDSSSSEDEKKKEKVNLKKVNLLKDQTMLFAPSASSSFMVYSTPNPLSKHAMKMTQIESVRKDHHIKGVHSPSGTPLSHEQTVVRNVKGSLKRKRCSDSDEESDKSDSVSSKFKDKSSSKRKRTDSNSESTSSEKLKNKHEIASDLKMEVDRPDSSTDDEDSVKTKRPDWLEEIVKNKRQIMAGDKLKVENSICFEDISSEDEIYTLQCPKELNIESLVGKKISLTGESLFEGLTKDKRLLAFETFAVSLPSMINLLLPSKIQSTLRLGGFEVKGSIIVSERCLIPEVDMSTFSSTGRESSSDDELNISTPLPSGLKLRHPLHGLNYKKTALPNFDAVISREKKHHKKKKKKHDEGETVEEMIDSLLAKKELSLKGYSDEFKKPLAPKSKSRSSGKLKEDSDRESERGIVIGKNMISLVSEDESRSSSKEEKSKKKKKNKKDNTEVVVQEPDVTEDSKQSKKKRKKDKMMEQMIREAEGSVGITSDPCESEGSLTKTKKEKKRKRDKAEQERPAENYIPVEESQPEIKKKKKKKNKEKDID